jgi:hypothetical protein
MSSQEGFPAQDYTGIDPDEMVMFGLDPTDEHQVQIWIAEITPPNGIPIIEDPYVKDRFEFGPDKIDS